MSSVVISGDTSGAITLAAPSVAGTNTATLPAATGTVMVTGNMPAFSYYLLNNITGVSSNTYTKITCDVKEFDTANAYSSGKFQPTIAGYYLITGVAAVDYTGSVPTRCESAIYKNGSYYKSSWGNNITYGLVNVSTVLYLNGSTDYIELYGRIGGGSGLQFDGYNNSSIIQSNITGVLVRSA
jgi:hypothetical protein